MRSDSNASAGAAPPAHTPIVRGEGITASERYLTRLADRSFLNLWCYPNVFIDKKQHGKGDGVELCDLLVVCGDHVLIFSDKHNAYPDHADKSVAWKRWARSAIEKSVKQIRGAERWIQEHPNRIFIDRACTQPLPIALPLADRRQVHGIAVALGAGEACRAHYNGGSGSLAIHPDVHGAAHWQGEAVMPFEVGDVAPDGSFIHVLDDTTLDIVMRELDTVTDFTRYLTRKAQFIRAGQLFHADGEEDLVGHYMTQINADGDHDFMMDGGRPIKPGVRLVLAQGIYARMRDHPQYIAMQKANRASYAWDALINAFTHHILGGTTETVEGSPTTSAEQEPYIRELALVDRFGRRILGDALSTCLRRGNTNRRFCRTVLPDPIDTGRAFLIMTLDPTAPVKDHGYDHYRKLRAEMLKVYAFGELERHRSLREIVGIAMEPPARVGLDGGTQDLLHIDQLDNWTPATLADLEDGKRHFNLMQPSNTRARTEIYAEEFPQVVNLGGYRGRNHGRPNRHERRKQAAEARKRR